MSLYMIKARHKHRTGMKECNERNLKENYPIEDWKRILLDKPGMSRVVIHETQKDKCTVIGYVLCDGKIVISVSVDKEFRRQGWARKMLQDILQHNPSMRGELILHVRKSNEGAQSLYQQLGFKQTQELPEYYKDKENALEMTWQ